jgi:hypothetical protein
VSTKSGKDKKEKKRQPLKDENGNDLKRPLSAYMLYNNYRRPVLRAEHSGKLLLCAAIADTALCRAHFDRPVEIDWRGVEKAERALKEGKCWRHFMAPFIGQFNY